MQILTSGALCCRQGLHSAPRPEQVFCPGCQPPTKPYLPQHEPSEGDEPLPTPSNPPTPAPLPHQRCHQHPGPDGKQHLRPAQWRHLAGGEHVGR